MFSGGKGKKRKPESPDRYDDAELVDEDEDEDGGEEEEEQEVQVSVQRCVVTTTHTDARVCLYVRDITHANSRAQRSPRRRPRPTRA